MSCESPRGGTGPTQRKLAAASLAASLAILASAIQLLGQISIQVRVVNVPATVTGRDGQFVGGLRRENFRLLVDGAEQRIEYFGAEKEPGRVLILVETGPAVYLLRREHISAAAILLQGLAPDDMVAVASYSDAPRLLLDFTPDKHRAAAALGELLYGVGMTQLNFYSSLASSVSWAERNGGKCAIVVLTTGLDSSGSGPGSWEPLGERLRQSNVLLLPVALGGELRGIQMRPGVRGGEERTFERSDRVLETMAAETGGQVFFPRSQRDFEQAYGRIASLLRNQYSLGFRVPSDDTGGRSHTIQVQVVDESGRVFDGRQAKPSYRVNFRRGFSTTSP
jgi:VWFA-related protein